MRLTGLVGDGPHGDDTGHRRSAVVFGAGSVGRGFIGQLLCEAGWQLTFVDADAALVERLQADAGYNHVTVSSAGSSRTWVAPVTAILSRDDALIERAVCQCDLIFTCVGAAVLPKVIGAMVPGLETRIIDGAAPVNVLLAENLHNAGAVARQHLAGQLRKVNPRKAADEIGFIETSIGRMIPVPDPAIRSDDPTIIFAEPYRLLPYDCAAVRGAMPELPSLVCDPKVPFSFYAERKLHVHNMGHFVCGLLAGMAGDAQLSVGIRRPEIRRITRAAMMESCRALAANYSQPLEPLVEYADDLLDRFDNPALGDTVERVIRDLPRKMAPDDRMVGALLAAIRADSPSGYLSLGVALGLYRIAGGTDLTGDGLMAVFDSIAGDDGMELSGRRRELLHRQCSALVQNGPDLDEQCMIIATSLSCDGR